MPFADLKPLLLLIALNSAFAEPAPLPPTIDLSSDTARQVIIAQGTPEVYQGHPTTLLLPDGKTMYAVWTHGHGGTCGPMKRSDDGGKSWSELLPTPENWQQVKNCPSLYRLTDPQGVTRCFVFTGQGPDGLMQQAMSADEGKTWSPMQSNGLKCVMPFCTIMPVEGGKKLLGLTNIRRPGETKDKTSNIIAQSESTDGGLTWNPLRIVLDLGELKPCEPALVRSPDGRQLLCLLRENKRHVALFMTSDDDGKTWSKTRLLPAGLFGDRHMPHYAADGRLVVCFRDTGVKSPTRNHFVAWVGHYEDIISGRDGQYRLKLLHSFKGGDCGYPGLELLPDGTFVATTYIKYREGLELNSVVSTRFTLAETDKQASVPPANPNASAFHIEHSIILTGPETMHWAQSRVALVAENPPRVILTTQQTEKVGAHGYHDVFVAETKDGARTWSTPQIIPSLERKRMPEGHDFVMGDICPQWHAATAVVLATGKTFGFTKGVTEDRKFERVSYAIFTPGTNQWSGLKLLEMPESDHEGKTILEPNAGCTQRFDLPGGDILLPIRYRKDPKTRQYTTIIARCGFDGTTLTYREHGSELTIPKGRGLYEPSVTSFQGSYYATLRGDESAFVARSKDGINYEPIVDWTFDDGKVLGSYSTQQHWVTHSDGLYLVYTRRGANNDRTFRNRAPLFIARVDPDRLCVLRASEQVLMPDTGLDLGAGFGTMDISANETWVVSSEMVFPKERLSEPNHVLLAKIIWARPNKLFSTSKP